MPKMMSHKLLDSEWTSRTISWCQSRAMRPECSSS